ncbi:uncharacterized protein LOC113519037 isoform X2 [Galleria mellonella]|uniref:Uncharacterized protein LOC113519037 isoform X2 n=1 Tax=Galleria mellonella TaxID=7137 RepID=A0A6J3C339_GALME|nr:uncharacterized protein LOC113519037 isoform X2 [Galleria mellonella]
MRKSPCKCPTGLQQICKHAKVTDCKDVAEIVEALTFEAESVRKSKRSRPPKFKTKPFKPRHFKDTCVPMVPSMHTRLRYIGHCDAEPPRPDRKAGRNFGEFEFESTSEEEETTSSILRTGKKREKFKKKVRYFDLLPGDILLPTPVPVIKHTASDKSILNVASPKTSGEVIPAQRTIVVPGEIKPPIPPKSAYELFKPHSGIIINRDKEFVPDVVHTPGSRKPRICYRKTCTRKKCRKYAAMRKRQMTRKIKRSRFDVPYTTIGEPIDGKPRASTQKHIRDDDSICGLDEIPKPEHVRIPANLKRGILQTHSLTVLPCTKERKPEIHYGILTGSFNMYDAKFSGRSKGRQALTISVMAYCLAFHYHPKQWTMKLVDSLVDAGDQWYLQCLEKVHDHSAVQGICEVLPFGKKQTLILNGKRMQVLLGEPDIVGYAMSLDPTVYNLCRGLKAFFKGNRAGILLTRVLKVVIWKDRICYYVFDPAGRDSRAYSNFTNGCSALINVKDLVSVAEILLARSVLEDQKFVLAPVKVLKMVDEKCDEDFESDRELTQAEKAMIGYRILNENSAIVNANMHLGDKCFEDAKFRQALTVAIVAITYAKISPPNTWFSKTLDKILRLGNILFAECSHPKVMIDLTIDNIPNEIIVGPYACEIIIYRERVKGQLFTTKECLLNIKTGLEEFFSREDNSGILQFNNYSLAIWRQKDMFYLFDPYPRTNDGLRSFKTGKACCLMLLNPETMASAFTKNWDYLPVTTQFHIHAFKVLKLKKKEPKMQIVCTLSDDQLSGANARIKRKVLPLSQAQGDGGEIIHDILPANNFNTINIDNKQSGPQVDEEQMGDIISLVDSIQEDYLPLIPLRYKNMGSEPLQDKVVNLDSPTVSVTQVVPPWPKPRDKTNELPEPDPDPEPTPPPTPPQLPPPEDGEEEEEEVGEEEDEDTMKRKKEEEQRKKAEEEARRKAEELPSPLPPPPPSPQPEPEVPLAPIQMAEDEVQTIQPVNVDRRILLSEDAHYRFKLRQLRKKMTPPLIEDQLEGSPSEELLKPSNFKDLPDKTQIVRGSSAITDANVIDILPFAAIMAIVTSYKYSINTWTSGIVNFIVDTAKKLYSNKLEKFQMAPIHIIPKIGIGHQAYQANIDVVGEGATWQLEDALSRKFFLKYDRGMITTSNYSCAVFKRNGLYYLYDGSSCNAMGIRDEKNKGKACFLRFSTLHDLVSRILYNKDGRTEDQQFILSRILVRRLLAELRMKLPEDYDYITGLSKSKPSIVLTEKDSEKRSFIESAESKSQTIIGYQLVEGIYRIEGTTSLKDRKPSSDVKSCHFVSLIAMLMAAMHPIRTWDHIMVDTCIEKGLEINEKATNLNVCEKRVIKNIILDGKFININIKKITVVNENPDKRLEQYLKAVLRRLRYVVIRFLQCSMAICQTDGYFHLFDPYPPPSEETQPQISTKDDQNKKTENPVEPKKASDVATWTLYRSIDALTHRIRKVISGSSVESPEFYTFELTSVKPAPRHSALNYRLSPLFKPDDNPNLPYLKRRRVRPIVDEKMYWLNIESIPWSRMNCFNDLGFERKTPRTMWKDWDIEFPGDLYSLWGSVHPLDKKFDDNHRGKQYLAISVVAIVMTKACNLSAWTGSFLDGIVINGDKYHRKCLNKIGNHPNYEIAIMDLDTKFDEMFPYSFSVKFNKIIFGFVYNHFPDRFNLSKALVYFFEKNSLGILTSPTKNLAFGKCDTSYFMFDCQSYGVPIFSPDQGASYMLKCESLNRLIYCITLTLNIRRHSQQFHLFSVNVSLTEKGK